MTKKAGRQYIADAVVMVEPSDFGFNPETAESNLFQKKMDADISDIRRQAMEEFDAFVSLLRESGIEVLVMKDDPKIPTPDAVFPNNWFSVDPRNQKIYLYPMLSEMRRNERREDIVSSLLEQTGYDLEDSLVRHEDEGRALEGTGSLILDHENMMAYAAISPRTDESVIQEWKEITGYDCLVFQAWGAEDEQIYHTNVMMTMADTFAVVAMEVVANPIQRAKIKEKLKETGKDLLEITKEQMNSFAGNMLQLRNKEGQKFLIMSHAAKESLTSKQIDFISDHDCKIISPELKTIETIGGGSARCMLAEIFK